MSTFIHLVVVIILSDAQRVVGWLARSFFKWFCPVQIKEPPHDVSHIPGCIPTRQLQSLLVHYMYGPYEPEWRLEEDTYGMVGHIWDDMLLYQEQYAIL